MSTAEMMTSKAIMLCHRVNLGETSQTRFERYKKLFCGTVYNDDKDCVPDALADIQRRVTYDHPTPQDVVELFFCGDVKQVDGIRNTCVVTPARLKIMVVKEFSYNLQSCPECCVVTAGRLPLNIHGLGVYFENYFEEDDAFEKITTEHEFQGLKESDKATLSLRRGIYLSNVRKNQQGTEFNLLRCSTNLNGPTEGIKDVDKRIIAATQSAAHRYFKGPADLNHVLAQVYENSKRDSGGLEKDTKAKIKSHSDKTKDMPRNGLIAFCTFYSEDIEKYKPSVDNPHDRMFKNGSVLTKIRFRLKDGVEDGAGLEKTITLTLYPNSLFLIPLSTNRLYTHEIVPSTLESDKIPTRLGYVIRCSNTAAVHIDGQTYIVSEKGKVTLKKATEADRAETKNLYKEENTTDKIIDYGDIDYSLNEGDYKQPRMSLL